MTREEKRSLEFTFEELRTIHAALTEEYMCSMADLKEPWVIASGTEDIQENLAHLDRADRKVRLAINSYGTDLQYDLE